MDKATVSRKAAYTATGSQGCAEPDGNRLRRGAQCDGSNPIYNSPVVDAYSRDSLQTCAVTVMRNYGAEFIHPSSSKRK